ncbi:GGDEF domain-containing protein [Jatrophihabitans telluris]|uniref:GGDEF domain-containing protein n=1 Tax=Jatrophihabitans telluris TaxID=2038343 RepID=A0ABY4R2G4_9ACTN|nr:GGDEF domain-containing protein [Jatrophihabitans telluris]UQX89325.1 GGDEF domain-containing protein [Jatrophihabitans telluris]
MRRRPPDRHRPLPAHPSAAADAHAYVCVYFLAVCLIAGLLTVRSVRYEMSTAYAGPLTLLVALSLGYGAIAARVDKPAGFLQARTGWANHESVWVSAGVVVLPPGPLSVLIIALFGAGLVRARRTGTARLRRVVFNGASMLIAGFAAALLVSWLRDCSLPGLRVSTLSELGIGLAAAALAGMSMAFTLVGRFLIAGPAPLRRLMPGRAAVLDELSAVAIGLICGLLVLHTAWLSPISLLLVALLQRSILARHLHVAAATDPKTGLLAVRAWKHEAANALARSTQAGDTAAVLMLDLDFFKRINDTHGHLVGDRVLRGVGQQLSRQLRAPDRLGRFGGEEFVVLLPDTAEAAAVEVAERLRASLRELRLPSERAGDDHGPSVHGAVPAAPDRPPSSAQLPFPVSASIGVAVLGRHGHSLEELLAAADEALFEAKLGGRDMVVTAGGS